MSSMFGLISRVRTPLKFGVLGAAAIASIAFIAPVKSHPEAVVYAVAARSKERAAAFAKTHGIEKLSRCVLRSLGLFTLLTWTELLDDPEIDAIYNLLPNGLHFEWTMKALAAGKHVLLEKPAANTVEETRKMFELAETKGLVLLEAFHYRFHPLAHRVKAIVESGELGAVKSTSASLSVPRGIMKADDIRFNYSLGGRALMDTGCYTINAMRYFAGADPTAVLSCGAQARIAPNRPQDRCNLLAPGINHLHHPLRPLRAPKLKLIPTLPIMNAVIQCEKGEIKVMNYSTPTLYHSITVTTTANKKSRVEKAYTFLDLGEPWWTTYRYQLEVFVNKVKGRTPHAWVTNEDSIKNMEAIESVYAKSGLGSHPKSEYVPN
ncbi:NAD(P)-binding protein [Mycena olivaceomarginata]|nr:NAD(P)-binding protein [Mycena olivaceomarginata]